MRFKGIEDLILLDGRKTWRGRVKNVFRRMWYALCRRNNAAQLEFICNLHPSYKGALSSDQAAALNVVAEYVKPSPLVTLKGKLVYRVPALEHVTLWQVIETRRAETATEIVTKWCTPVEGQPAEYAPENIYHLLSTSKYVKTQIEMADKLEQRLFPFALQDATPEEDEIKIAKNVLTLLQATAELFNCTVQEAKRENYLDAVLAISKRHEENEKQKAEMKKHYNK